MQTFLPEKFAASEADQILRDCVHCGMCNAVCPTYQVERNELDGPRGRIYLIKQMLEGQETTAITRHYLDRCLTCQACETACPSGVDYHRLLDIGKREVERIAPRSPLQRSLRALLRSVMSKRRLTVPLMSLARLFRPLLPKALAGHVPLLRPAIASPDARHQRRVILVQGCVQPAMAPTTNQAAARVLDELGISTVSVTEETCCGALSYHTSGQVQGLRQARRNIDAWWPLVEAGAEAIVMTASGCSNFVQDYGRLLADDPAYADRAARVTELLRDIADVMAAEDLSRLELDASERISWHCPCTAQHGQKIDGPAREVLTKLGFSLPPVRDAQLCCGSAGSYSLFQPELAKELRDRKLAALQASQPRQIVTANIGCQVHLGGATDTPVVHWIELVARSLRSTMKE